MFPHMNVKLYHNLNSLQESSLPLFSCSDFKYRKRPNGISTWETICYARMTTDCHGSGVTGFELAHGPSEPCGVSIFYLRWRD